jgi:Uma2 family endonuclease
VVTNISGFLWRFKTERSATWFPMIGTGTRVPAAANSLPQPDVMVKEHPPTGTAVSDDALVVFEVLSRSNTKADQEWRRKVYVSVPNCRHYVTVSLRAVAVVAHDRDAGWAERRLTKLADSLELLALGLSMPVADIYRWTPLGER